MTPFAGPYLNYTRHVPLGVSGLITPVDDAKALGQALRQAVAAGDGGIRSTKGLA